MAMDAVPIDLLRSSLDSLKLRFQAVWDSGIDNRAIVVQRIKLSSDSTYDRLKSDIEWLFIHANGFSKSDNHIHRDADGRALSFINHSGDTALEFTNCSGARWRSDKSGPPFGFDRWHQVIGLRAVEVAAIAAGRLLNDLPENVRLKLWDANPVGMSLPDSGGWTLWLEAVFALAWQEIAGSPLRADMWTPSRQIEWVVGSRKPMPDDEDWFATLPNIAAASVQAIAILQSWLSGADAGEPINVEFAAESVWRSYFNLPDDVCDLMARLMDNWPELRQSLTPIEQATVRAVCRLLPEQPPKHIVAGAADLFATRQFLEAVTAFNDATPTPKGRGQGGTLDDAEFVFRRDGKGYFIRGLGEEGRVSAIGAKGLHDIYRLIPSPGIPVPMLELDAGTGAKKLGGDSQSKQLVADGQTKQSIAAKRKQLQADIAEADSELERAELQNELESLEAEAGKLFGIGGKARDLNNPNDRLRSKLLGRKTAACKRMKDEGLKELASHFDLAIMSERDCLVYRSPIPHISWHTEPKV